MDLLEVWIAKFEDSKDFKKSPILFVDEKIITYLMYEIVRLDKVENELL